MLPLPPFEWAAPVSLADALEALAEAPHETLLLGGGTDVLPNLKRGLGGPRRIVGLGRIDELARIEERSDGGLWLGAGLTLERVATEPRVIERYPALATAAGAAASPQLRRMGTLGGNLCLDTRCAFYDQSAFWRGALGHCLKTQGDTCHVVAGGRRCVAALAADTPAPLVAYGADVALRSVRGERRIALLELYAADGAHHLTRKPDEILTAVILPVPAAGLRAAYVKLRARQAIDFPLLSVAAAVSDDDVRVVIAALGPRPRLVRLPPITPASTATRPLTPEQIEAIAAAAQAQCRPLANLGEEGWRSALVPVAVRRALAALAIVAAVTSAEADVTGVVRDETGQPVAGARVSREASGAAVVADGDGAFALPASDGVVTIVAAARGYFHASARVASPSSGVTLTLAPVPLDDDASYRFQTPTACEACHPEQVAAWEGSPMARAGVNTWVYDLYDGTGTPGGGGGFVYTRDSMLAPHNPASECASCHQPEPWAATPYSPLLPLDEAGAQHGVSCEICHRMAELDEEKVNFPGLYPGAVRMARSATFSPVQFGLLGDTGFVAGAMRPSYQPQLAAAVCAACHQDKNDPDEDGDFEEDNGVISEPTYLEWRASSCADPGSPDHATCVDCHMPATDTTVACNAYTPDQPRPPGQLRSHRIEGTTAAFLEAAVSVRVAAEVAGDELLVDVELENDRTGHHVPTGVTVRNMILLVEARRATDGTSLVATGAQVVDELGGVGDPTAGYLAGLPGKLYAKVPVDAAGHGPVFFTEAAALAVDDRLAAHAIDRTSYRFELPRAGGPVDVEARVIYRRAFRALVDAKGWTTDGHGRPLADLAPPHFGHLMASARTTIDAPPVDGSCGCRGGGALPGVLAVLGGLPLVLGRHRRRARRRLLVAHDR